MSHPAGPAPFERSARRDLRVWGLFLVGLGFAWTGSVVEPAANCNAAGECAPWLVPLAKWLGIAFAAAGFGQLWVNPRRGSRIDPDTGDLVFWQRRFGRNPGDAGRIHPSRIGRIVIVRDSDSDDEVHLYDLDGAIQPYFDAEVIPWPRENWARRLAEQWPQIIVEVRG